MRRQTSSAHRRFCCQPRQIPATGDLDELRAIHRHLFQDVYDWAGTVRTVDIKKSTEGAEYFVPVSLIHRAAAFTAEELRADDRLNTWSRDVRRRLGVSEKPRLPCTFTP